MRTLLIDPVEPCATSIRYAPISVIEDPTSAARERTLQPTSSSVERG